MPLVGSGMRWSLVRYCGQGRGDAPVPQFDAKALSELDSIHEAQGKPDDASGKPVPPHEGWGSAGRFTARTARNDSWVFADQCG